MSQNTTWTALGSYDKAAKPNLMAQIFAVLTAAQAFSDPAKPYPWLMAVLLVLGAAWIGYCAFTRKSWLGLLIPAASLVWVVQLSGANPFASVSVWFFAHVVLAMLFGTAAYTFMRNSASTATPIDSPANKK